MGDFDLTPPPMPGEHKEEKTGIFKKLFSRKKQESDSAVPLSQTSNQAPNQLLNQANLQKEPFLEPKPSISPKDAQSKSTVPLPSSPFSKMTASPSDSLSSSSSVASSDSSDSSAPSLDEIKKKLGIMDDFEELPLQKEDGAPIASTSVSSSISSQKVEIHDWTQDVPAVEDTQVKSTRSMSSASWVEDKASSLEKEDTKQKAAKGAKERSKEEKNKDSNNGLSKETSIVLPATNNRSEDEMPAFLPQKEADELVLPDAVSVPEARLINSKSSDSKNPLQISESHALIEKHLADIDRQHEQVTNKLEQIRQGTVKLPEWKLQDKEVTPDLYFILRNGQPIKSIVELTDALGYVDDITFEHHVNDYRNDFANWVNDVIKDESLANELRSANTREDMLKVLISYQRSKSKDLEKDHQQLQKTLKKRKESVSDLLSTEKELADLERKIAQRSQAVADEKKKLSGDLKKRVDSEIQKGLSEEKESLNKAKLKVQADSKELNSKAAVIAQKERELSEKERKLVAEDIRIKQERMTLDESKKEFAPLMQKAESVKSDLEQLKKTAEKDENILKDTKAREALITRKEEAILAKEKKMSADLTRLNELQAQLDKQKVDIAEQKASLQKDAAEAKKLIAESKTRGDQALAAERSSKEKIAAEQKRLDALKAQIDKKLSSATSIKDRTEKAAELRRQYSSSLSSAKKDIALEREQLEKEAYASMIEEKSITTPIGQPSSVDLKEVLKVKHAQIYEKVELCRHALETKDLNSAKQLYNELRDLYAKTSMGQSEKETLYNDIRELYDDIHLMMLG